MTLWLAGSWCLAITSAIGMRIAIRRQRIVLDAAVKTCHELRGPHMMMLLALESPRLVQQEDRRSQLVDQLRRAEIAVQDLAELTTHNGLKDERREVELVSFIESQIAVFTSAAQSLNRRLDFRNETEVGTSTFVYADRGRLTQILCNLINNALEHGEGTATVVLQNSTKGLLISVVDQGVGLTVPLRQAIKGDRRGIRGRGLGIVAHSARSIGGSVQLAANEFGRGISVELASK